MFEIPEQFSAMTQLEAQLRFFSNVANKAFEGAQKIMALNISATKASVEKSSSAVQTLLAAKDPGEFFALGSVSAQPKLDSFIAYGRELFTIASSTQAELFNSVKAVAPSPAAATSKRAATMITDAPATKPAPAIKPVVHAKVVAPATKPAVAKPVIAKPAVAKPVVAKSDVAKPVVAKSVLAAPATAKSAVAKPAAKKAAPVTKPAIVKPAAKPVVNAKPAPTAVAAAPAKPVVEVPQKPSAPVLTKLASASFPTPSTRADVLASVKLTPAAPNLAVPKQPDTRNAKATPKK